MCSLKFDYYGIKYTVKGIHHLRIPNNITLETATVELLKQSPKKTDLDYPNQRNDNATKLWVMWIFLV